MHSAVRVTDKAGADLARGIVNYDSKELRLIAGQSSKAFEHILGYVGSDEAISRANLVVTGGV